MRYAIAAGIAFFLAGAAGAAEHTLSGAEIRTALSDHTVVGIDNGRQWTQLFQAAGVTVYTIDGNGATGYWEIRVDRYCSQWPPREAWSCYAVTGDGDRLTFVSSTGKTWPAKILDP